MIDDVNISDDYKSPGEHVRPYNILYMRITDCPYVGTRICA